MADASSSTEELLRNDPHEIHGTRSAYSTAYWDTDEDGNDCGTRPRDLYGTFTWTIDNFSEINDTNMSSDSFDVGAQKWSILIYPRGMDSANTAYLSIFLCVDKHDELPQGWSHFAQFTICLVNQDTTKSKYSDTLHRFWNKERDWGWKRMIELSRLHNGFLTDDALTITTQVQVIRERVDRPFRCLHEPYQRELSKVYLTNVEQIYRRFVDERRNKILKLVDDETTWSRLTAFWLGNIPSVRQDLVRENADTVLRVLVKHFFVEKEVTSTILMDSFCVGLKIMKQLGKNREEMGDDAMWEGEHDDHRAPLVHFDKDNGMFVLADDPIQLFERVALLDSGSRQPSKDDKSSENCSNEEVVKVQVGMASGSLVLLRMRLASFNMDGSTNSTADYNVRLAMLGWKLLEFFILAHILSQIESAHWEAIALRQQDESIEDVES